MPGKRSAETCSCSEGTSLWLGAPGRLTLGAEWAAGLSLGHPSPDTGVTLFLWLPAGHQRPLRCPPPSVSHQLLPFLQARLKAPGWLSLSLNPGLSVAVWPAPGTGWAWTGTRGGLLPLGLGRHLGEADRGGRVAIHDDRTGAGCAGDTGCWQDRQSNRAGRRVQPTHAPAPRPQGHLPTVRVSLVLNFICCGTGVTTSVTISMCPAQEAGRQVQGQLMVCVVGRGCP